jgi:hypothetical protein
VENAEDEGEGEGEGKQQWLAVGTAEACGELRELLSTMLLLCYVSVLLLRTMENAEDEGEEEEQWLAVETKEVGDELLSIVHTQREQWIMQKTKEKMKGKRAMAGTVS